MGGGDAGGGGEKAKEAQRAKAKALEEKKTGYGGGITVFPLFLSTPPSLPPLRPSLFPCSPPLPLSLPLPPPPLPPHVLSPPLCLEPWTGYRQPQLVSSVKQGLRKTGIDVTTPTTSVSTLRACVAPC